MKRLFILAGLILAFMLFFSCNAKVVVDLNVDSSGVADVAVDLDPMLTQYIFDLQSVFTDVSAEEAEQLFDPGQTKVMLEKSKTVRVKSIDASDKNKMKMKFAFKTLNQVLDEGNRQIESDVQADIKKVINLTVEKSGVKKVTFCLNKENFKSLTALIPEEAQSLVSLFAPPGYDVDPDEYLEVLKLNFIEYSPEYIGEKIKDSKFSFKVNFGGQLISHKGGIQKGNSLTVEVPLLDILILKDPIEFEARFK